MISLPFLRKKADKAERGTEVTLLNDSEDKECSSKEKIIEPTLKQSIFHYRTLYIWILIILSSSFPFYIASNFKSYESIDVDDESFITLVGSIGAVVNGVSRGGWATLQDIFGFK